jgi:hypothetical protein
MPAPKVYFQKSGYTKKVGTRQRSLFYLQRGMERIAEHSEEIFQNLAFESGRE